LNNYKTAQIEIFQNLSPGHVGYSKSRIKQQFTFYSGSSEDGGLVAEVHLDSGTLTNHEFNFLNVSSNSN